MKQIVVQITCNYNQNYIPIIKELFCADCTYILKLFCDIIHITHNHNLIIVDLIVIIWPHTLAGSINLAMGSLK